MSWLPSTGGGGGGADPQTAVNTADIATIEGEQTTQDSAISANTSDIATNASGVSTNATTVFNLGSDVSGNWARLNGIDIVQAAQNTAIALNTSKVSNATHTGDVTGSTALTLDSSAVTGQTLVTADALDHVLIADASDGALKKALVSDLGADNFVAQASAPTGDTGLLWLDTDEALPAVAPVAPVVESTTAFTLSSTHSGKVVECTNAGATTITVPTDAADDLPDGYWALLVCEGAGGITVSHAGTWRGSSPTTTAAQNGKLLVIKTATANTWIVLS